MRNKLLLRKMNRYDQCERNSAMEIPATIVHISLSMNYTLTCCYQQRQTTAQLKKNIAIWLPCLLPLWRVSLRRFSVQMMIELDSHQRWRILFDCKTLAIWLLLGQWCAQFFEDYHMKHPDSYHALIWASLKEQQHSHFII